MNSGSSLLLLAKMMMRQHSEWYLCRVTKLCLLCLFTSITGQWDIRACSSWGSLGPVVPFTRYSSSCLDYEQECFYWMVRWGNILLVLDVFTMGLSIVNNYLANYHMFDSGKPLIVAGRDGAAEVYFLADCFGDGPTDLIRLTKQSDDGSSDEWQLENMISLPSQYNYYTLGAAEGFLFLCGVLQDQNSGYSSEDSSDDSGHQSVEYPDVEYFSLDVRTSERKPKKICGMKRYFHTVYPYSATHHHWQNQLYELGFMLIIHLMFPRSRGGMEDCETDANGWTTANVPFQTPVCLQCVYSAK